MKYKVFIDGREGTTGLEIESRLSSRDDVELLIADPERRKDAEHRRELINAADAAFLCLPDAAAVESAALCENEHTVIIDTSTAHRTAPGWVYGLPELGGGAREAVCDSKRIGNPGCHATGFIVCAAPLVNAGVIDKSAVLHCCSLTGYSGGGKKMIAAYEAADRPAGLSAPRQYALAQSHKHLAEMAVISGLQFPPVFTPIVCDFYSGMAVTVYLDASTTKKPLSPEGLMELYKKHYDGEALFEVSAPPESGQIAANEMSRAPGVKLYVAGNGERLTVTSVFDNLCKGASGAAIQNMNLALGLPEYKGILE